MPRLGEPVEPSRADRVEPWWRQVTGAEPVVPEEEIAATEATVQLPID
jgi:hypothetical protein